jgi:hypothetical protein
MTANAGYKTFNTGDVLTAAQVQYNLQNQSVMYFATTTARDAALTGSILVDGMVAYTPATGVMVYNGSAWVSIAASSIPTSYGFTAGKNAIINGDFYVNQRNFSSTSTSATFMFDRWTQYISDGTVTYTSQTFTPGTAPVAGYEGKTYLRCAISSQTLTTAGVETYQTIEDVRSFAGQTITVSFWAKATSGTPKIALELYQNFGSGGSPSTAVSTPAGTVTISTSWTRYSITASVPSISGKTIGTNPDGYLGINLWYSAGSTFATRASSIGIQNNTFDLWGVQVESGSTATSFQTATGTKQGELAACQRYFTISTYGGEYIGGCYSTTAVALSTRFPVSMRVAPTATYSTNYTNAINVIGSGAKTPTAYTTTSISTDGVNFTATGMAALVIGTPAIYASGSAQQQFSAEL